MHNVNIILNYSSDLSMYEQIEKNIKEGSIMGLIGENGDDEVFVKNNIGYAPAESYLLYDKTI